MKFATYTAAGVEHCGVVVEDGVIGLDKLGMGDHSTSLMSLIQAGGDGVDRIRGALAGLDPTARAAAVMPLDAVRLQVPLPRPTKVICVARNYAEHAREAGLEMPKMPILFPRFANTLVAQGRPVVVPTVSEQLDWEGELAVVIGRDTNGRIRREEAMDYIFGYSIFNDVTVRDYQFRVTQYTGGKNFRSSGPFGPFVVTADEIGDPHTLQITTRLNGKVMQDANTSTMIFDLPTILVHIADFIDLEAGDVIMTGTPAGVGFKRQPPIFLKDGDSIEVTIDKLGTLSNPVVAEALA